MVCIGEKEVVGFFFFLSIGGCLSSCFVGHLQKMVTFRACSFISHWSLHTV